MREARITKELQLHDRQLFCQKDYKGRFAIFRTSFAHEPCWIDDQTVIQVMVERPHHILSLTDNWGASGTPVDWGLEPIMSRIKEIDGHGRDLVREMDESLRKSEETKERRLNSETEAFVKDWRKDFVKATSDINTSTMEKIDSRRIAERKVKYGNSK